MFKVQKFKVANQDFRAVIGDSDEVDVITVEVKVDKDIYRIIPRGMGVYKKVRQMFAESKQLSGRRTWMYAN
jgi:hypothetical protein